MSEPHRMNPSDRSLRGQTQKKSKWSEAGKEFRERKSLHFWLRDGGGPGGKEFGQLLEAENSPQRTAHKKTGALSPTARHQILPKMWTRLEADFSQQPPGKNTDSLATTKCETPSGDTAK